MGSNNTLYAFLQNITDPATKKACKVIFDQISLLQGNTNAVAWKGDLHAGTNRLTNLADGTADQDAVTLAQLTAATDPKRFQQALSASGDFSLVVTGLIGTSDVTVGPHATRVATTPNGPSSIFFENDRFAFYWNSGGAWKLGGNFLMDGDLLASRPSDLGVADDGFYFQSIDQNYIIYRWTGNLWRYHSGVLVDTFANRPLWSATDVGMVFVASDYGYQMWISDYVSAGWLLLGGGKPYATNTAGIATVGALLGTGDVGFRVNWTTFDREITWSGTAWGDSPGQPARKQVNFFYEAPGTGWFLADNAAHTISKSDGTTESYTPARSMQGSIPVGGNSFPAGVSYFTDSGLVGLTYQTLYTYFRG